MACENDKCDRYGLHHDYENGVEVRKCQFCECDDKNSAHFAGGARMSERREIEQKNRLSAHFISIPSEYLIIPWEEWNKCISSLLQICKAED